MRCHDLGWQRSGWKEALEPFVSSVDFPSQHLSARSKWKKKQKINFRKYFLHIKVCYCFLTINQPDYQS